MDESCWKGPASAGQGKNDLLDCATGDSSFESPSDRQHMDQRKITEFFWRHPLQFSMKSTGQPTKLAFPFSSPGGDFPAVFYTQLRAPEWSLVKLNNTMGRILR